MTLQRAIQWMKLAILAMEVLLRLLRCLPRLRKEGRQAITAAGLAYVAAWEALADRDLSREEAGEARGKLEALGREVEDVLQVMAEALGLQKEKI
jgi:hypothetical protein